MPCCPVIIKFVILAMILNHKVRNDRQSLCVFLHFPKCCIIFICAMRWSGRVQPVLLAFRSPATRMEVRPPCLHEEVVSCVRSSGRDQAYWACRVVNWSRRNKGFARPTQKEGLRSLSIVASLMSLSTRMSFFGLPCILLWSSAIRWTLSFPSLILPTG